MMLHLEKSKGEEAEADENKPLLTEWKTKWKKKNTKLFRESWSNTIAIWHST